MNSLHVLLVFHLLAAVIWVGGHLLLSIMILPGVLKRKDVDTLLDFEKRYEVIGLPALAVLVITGVWMAYLYGVTISKWFSFSNAIENVVSLKLLLLGCIVALALSAQFRVIPGLKKGEHRLLEMSCHIILVTTLSILMLILGSFIRYGGI